MHGTDTVSSWVARWAPLIPQGQALDLACGSGRHARLLAGFKHAVTALDRDPQALLAAAGKGIATLQHDLEAPGAAWPFAPGSLAGIVVTNYLHRPLFGHIAEALAPDGVLIYETFARGNEVFGKPSNPDFLLNPGELLELASRGGLRVLAYEDGVIDAPKRARVQRLCAVGAAFDLSTAKLDR
ncbi:class I SAM-dependent methyltransferase [Massilia sp. LXY-6]|uniref:class I SAM-dependent methyltransferase n=1 Tax=Massilia sp. LXY-6 TaxID=3379823 RepID=UPI003EE19BA8